MLPPYPLYIGRQSPSPQSQFTPPPADLLPIRSHLPVLPHLFIFHHSIAIDTGSSHFVSGGGKVLAHATSVSPWLRLVIAAIQTPKHCRGGVTGGMPVPAF